MHKNIKLMDKDVVIKEMNRGLALYTCHGNGSNLGVQSPRTYVRVRYQYPELVNLFTIVCMAEPGAGKSLPTKHEYLHIH